MGLGAGIVAIIGMVLSSSAAQEPASQPEIYGPVGQFNVVPNVSLRVTQLRVDFTTFRDATMADTNLSVNEKVRLIVARSQAIQNDLTAERNAAYQSYYRRVANEHSCSNGSGGGEITCTPGPEKCFTAPLGEYTTGAWANTRGASDVSMASLRNLTAGVWRQNGASMVRDNGQTLCPDRLRKSSRGVIRAYGLGIFRYRPEYVTSTVSSEIAAAMAHITS